MKKNRHITAFYLETILLIVVFMTIIMVLTQVFGAGKAQSTAAKRLTSAISLAENAAEAVSASDSREAVLSLLNEKDNAVMLEGNEIPTIEVRYDETMKPDPDGRFRITVTWEPQEQRAWAGANQTSPENRGEAAGGLTVGSSGGTYIASSIKAFFDEAETPVYTLETGVYVKGVDR